MAFSDNLKRLRKRSGLTQEGLALACGWQGQSRVANYEKGSREPSLDELPVLASALGATVADLLGTAEAAPAEASQVPGLDQARLDVTIQFLEELFDSYGRVFEARDHTNLLAQVYTDLSQPSAMNWVALTRKYGPQLAGGSDDERQGEAGSAGENDRNPTRRRTKKAGSKAG